MADDTIPPRSVRAASLRLRDNADSEAGRELSRWHHHGEAPPAPPPPVAGLAAVAMGIGLLLWAHWRDSDDER